MLARAGRSLSPEARAAVDAYRGVRGEELDALLACASGRELVAGGWEEDVRIAAEVGSSATVPVLVGGRFVDRAGRPLRA
ncbi:hypothetical protein GCM10010972_13540 [Cellulomonas carbonis]|nr:hypothetical protein GCM10010972_13540 [Cellulomonas carbonis]